MSSKRHVRSRQCDSKHKYRKEVVQASAHVLTLKYGEVVQGYRCKWCHQWHIGHRPAK